MEDFSCDWSSGVSSSVTAPRNCSAGSEATAWRARASSSRAAWACVPGKHHALAAGLSETGGGALVLLGAATPLASAALIATMLTAINRVHLKNGPWVSDGGYEYNLVLIAAALALAETGPGAISVDAARGSEAQGSKWALIALLLGVAGAAGAHAYAESQAAPAEPSTPAPAPDTAAAPAAV